MIACETEMTVSEIRGKIKAGLTGDGYSVWANDRRGQNDFICEIQRGERSIAEAVKIINEWAEIEY